MRVGPGAQQRPRGWGHDFRADTQSHRRRHDRQRARMVRLCNLRILRGDHRPPVLSARERRRAAPFRVRHIRGRLSHAPNRRRTDRPHRRSLRAPRRADLLGARDGGSHLLDRLVAGIRDTRPGSANCTYGAARGAGTFRGRRIHQLHGVPGGARARRPPRIDGCAGRERRHLRHPARLGGRRRFCREHVRAGAGDVGLARSVPVRSRGRNRRLLAAPSRSGNRAARTAQARPDRRDAARSLARRGGLRRLVRVQCGRLLRELRLSRELAADRRARSRSIH